MGRRNDEAVHFLAYEGEYAIGTARLLGDGHIGRVSVLKDWRGLKVGDALMRAAIEEAERRGLKRQLLTAQVYAIPSTSDWASRSIAANSSMPACPMSTWFATATEADERHPGDLAGRPAGHRIQLSGALCGTQPGKRRTTRGTLGTSAIPPRRT